MKTPKKLTFVEFDVALSSFYADECAVDRSTHEMICRTCKSKIRLSPVLIRLHDARVDRCDETESIQQMRLPYCPKCEFPPRSEGCLHVPSPAVFLEWCSWNKDIGQLVLVEGKPLVSVERSKVKGKSEHTLRFILPVKETVARFFKAKRRAKEDSRKRRLPRERRSGKTLEQQIDEIVKSLETAKHPADREALRLKLALLRDRSRKCVPRSKGERRSRGGK
jgi:hypothetical protein